MIMTNNEYLFDNFDILQVLDKEMLSPLEILSAELASDTMTTSSSSTEAQWNYDVENVGL